MRVKCAVTPSGTTRLNSGSVMVFTVGVITPIFARHPEGRESSLRFICLSSLLRLRHDVYIKSKRCRRDGGTSRPFRPLNTVSSGVRPLHARIEFHARPEAQELRDGGK